MPTIAEQEIPASNIALKENDIEDKFTAKYDDSHYYEYIENFTPNIKRRFFYRFVKRAFDIVSSLCGMILLSPVMLGIAIAIKLDSKGPVVFKQKRVGKNGAEFNIYKFRSMTVSAPHDCATSLLEKPEQYITKVGGFLRKTSLDELPQLWCVFIGTMSVIGYRPLVLTEVKCNEMRRKLNVFSMRPGVSGYAQTQGRDDVHYKDKAVMDAEYVKNASLLFDLKLIFKTISVVLKREGNDQEKIDNRDAQVMK